MIPSALPRRLRSLTAGAVALAVLLVTASAACAAPPSTGGISISPVTPSHRLLFDAHPGALIRARVRVRNTSTSSRSVALWTTDIVTGETGGMDFPDRPARGIKSWLRLSDGTVRVPAHSHRDVVLVARLPLSAQSGELFAGVVAVERHARNATATGSGVRLRTVVRLALPVTFRLPGTAIRGLAADSADFVVDAVGTNVALRLRSTGNSRIRGTRIDLRLLQGGRTVMRHRAALADIFPETSLRYRIPWRAKQPATGDYRLVGIARFSGGPPVRVDLPLTFGSRHARELDERTDAAPVGAPGTPAWLIALAVGAVMVAMSLAAAYLRMRHRLLAAG